MAERLQRRPESPDSNCPETATLAASVPRVRRSRRKPVPSELIVSTSLPPNESHPLSNLDHAKRVDRRVKTMATVLAETAKRIAAANIKGQGGTR